MSSGRSRNGGMVSVTTAKRWYRSLRKRGVRAAAAKSEAEQLDEFIKQLREDSKAMGTMLECARGAAAPGAASPVGHCL